ncbi:type II toxin-antitoxin system RelE family toxin [Nocardia asteroides]|uniref:type II toxin-antitoxin system RelE family toxin n=1 Tax=Nocardia asteroides TaxID=1824 RepID=UPI001E3120F2|nr:type II toxin-antitoxin system mRNA interferase toxin, RelE/StbE family [Nocardia asteroides]UGT60583.1 type II toxin-antitoxin system mRNA interferase toxin, RelE/StbE family [Nocardia asteroides]
MVEVLFTDAAIDDLRKLGPDAVPKVLKKILLLLDSAQAGYPLGGELTGFRKLVVGRNTWRVVYRVVDQQTIEVCEVWAIGARADSEVYAEATARIVAAAGRLPEFSRLGSVVERLGRNIESFGGAQEPPREPVPDWLARRLIHTVGMAPAEVAALDLEQAVDRWAEYTSRP